MMKVRPNFNSALVGPLLREVGWASSELRVGVGREIYTLLCSMHNDPVTRLREADLARFVDRHCTNGAVSDAMHAMLALWAMVDEGPYGSAIPEPLTSQLLKHLEHLEEVAA